MASFRARQFQMTRGCEGRLHRRLLEPSTPTGTVLYIHGLGESGLCFEHLMADERLAHWRHLAIDLEGYGKSSWAEEPLSLTQHAESLGELIAQSTESLVVLGHSMGGVIGTRLCHQLGAAVSGFINVEGNISLPDCGYSSQAVKFSLEEWLAGGFDQVLDAIYAHEGESTEVRRAYGASILMCDPRTYHRNSQELVEISSTETGARLLAELDAKVIYIHGSPRGTGARSLELLEQADINTIRIDGAGHWPFLDQHDAFVETMLDFQDGLERR